MPNSLTVSVVMYHTATHVWIDISSQYVWDVIRSSVRAKSVYVTLMLAWNIYTCANLVSQPTTKPTHRPTLGTSLLFLRNRWRRKLPRIGPSGRPGNPSVRRVCPLRTVRRLLQLFYHHHLTMYQCRLCRLAWPPTLVAWDQNQQACSQP